MISVDLFDNKIAMFQSRSEVACSLTLDAVPGDLDLLVYLNIEMAADWLQWVSFAAMSSLTLNLLSVVTVGGMSGVFCHYVVGVGLGCQVPFCFLFGLYVIYILDCKVYKYKSSLSQKRYCLVRFF